MEFIVAGVVIFAIFVLGLILAVEMVDAINRNRNGLFMKTKIVVTIKTAWWFEYYFYTLLFFCELLNTEPDYEKLGNVYKKP